MNTKSLRNGSFINRTGVFILLFSILVISSFTPASVIANQRISSQSIQQNVATDLTQNQNQELQTTKGSAFDLIPEDSRYDLLRKHLEKEGAPINAKVISPFLLNLQDRDLNVQKDGTMKLVVSLDNRNKYADVYGLASRFGFSVEEEIPRLNAFVFKGKIDAFNNFLLSKGSRLGVEYVEPVVYYQLDNTEKSHPPHLMGTPNDPMWNDQYGPQIIRADKAWGQFQTPPSEPVIVAVIDTGVDYNHPDLQNIYLPGGYDWYNDDNDPMDDHDHGTHVAGIIAAEINNSIGIAGVAGLGSGYVKVMAEKFLSSWGSGSDTDAANAIIHAVDFGADILSNSWGGGPSDLIAEAMAYAEDNGVIVIAAAGNGFGQDADFNYPAALPSVISVSSTDENDQLSYFSSYGYTVDVAAPGSSILSTVRNGDYEFFSGTSMATPHVSATAALMLLRQPDLTPFEVRTLLHDTSVDLGDEGFDVKFGYGRIDVLNATTAAVRPNTDLRATIYVPQQPTITNSIIRVTIGLFNFGTSTQDLSYSILQNGKVVASGTESNMAGGTYLKYEHEMIVVNPQDVVLQAIITPVAGETNIANNNATQVLSFGKQTYSMKPMQFEWDDARNGGRNLGLVGDDIAVDVPLPFAFPFFGDFNFDTAFASTNGYISFVDPSGWRYYPAIFPDDYNPFVIAPFWTDMIMFDFGDGGNTTNDVPEFWVKERNDSVILQWTNAKLYFDPTARITFQAVLYKDGDIQFNYLNAETEFVAIGVNKGLRSMDYTTYWSPLDGPISLTNMSLLFTSKEMSVANELGVSLYTSLDMTLPNSNNTIEFGILNYGTADATNVAYDMAINGTSVMNGSTDVDAGFGEPFSYEWMPTVEGHYVFNISVAPYLNETDLQNNFIVFEVDVVSSNLNVPFGTPMYYQFDSELFGGLEEWPLLEMHVEETEDPLFADLWLTYIDLFTGEVFIESSFRFNVLTFELEGGWGQMPFILPTFADVGYSNEFGEIVSDTTYDFQGTSLTGWLLEDSWGTSVVYDQETGAMLSYRVPFYNGNGTSPETVGVTIIAAHGVLATPSVNQFLDVFAIDGPVNAETQINAFVMNTGSSTVSGTTLQLKVDGQDVFSMDISSLDPTSYTVVSVNYTVSEGVHLAEGSLSAATSETYLEDNADTDTFIGMEFIAVFQDDYPFFSYMLEDVITYGLGMGVKYFGSNDIGNVNISAYKRVIIASSQTASFQNKVSSNTQWFENYAENGGILEIHAASDQGYGAGPGYTSLPGGVSVVNAQDGYNQISIMDPTSDLFTTPNLISDAMLSNWYWSAYGYLSINDPLTKVYAKTTDVSSVAPVIAAKAQGDGFIIYTTMPVEAWWGSYSFLENLVQFVPNDVPTSGNPPSIQGNENVIMYYGQWETLIYVISSDFYETYSITIDGDKTVYNWNEKEKTIVISTENWTVGEHSVKIDATDLLGQTTSMETTVKVLPQGGVTVTKTVSATTTPTNTSVSSSESKSPFNMWAVVFGLVFIAIMPIIRKKK